MIKELGNKLLKMLTVPIVRKLWVDSIVGLENIPRDRGAILISNHASYLDFLILGSIIEGIVGRPLYFWANTKVCNHKVFKYYTKCFNSIEVDYEKTSNKFWKETIDKLNDNQLICIFPEGTRTRTGRVGEFNAGYLRLANTTQSQIIPITIHGTFKILPPHRHTPTLKKCKVIINAPYTINKRASKTELLEVNQVIYDYYFKRHLR